MNLKGNYLQSADDIRHVLQVPSITVLDIQKNKIDQVEIVSILADMPNLKVLYLQGNDVVKKIPQYRKTIISKCKKLTYLDDRPIFEDERRRVQAWGIAMEESSGDTKFALEAERAEMAKIRQEKKDKEALNFQMFEDMIKKGKQSRDNALPPPPPSINAFSGEPIVPVQDSQQVREAREKRWEVAVGDAAQLPPPIPTGSNSEMSDERRKILQQCSSIGSTVHNLAMPPPPPAQSTPVQESSNTQPIQNVTYQPQNIPLPPSAEPLMTEIATKKLGVVSLEDAPNDAQKKEIPKIEVLSSTESV